jgi:hypothetical protein
MKITFEVPETCTLILELITSEILDNGSFASELEKADFLDWDCEKNIVYLYGIPQDQKETIATKIKNIVRRLTSSNPRINPDHGDQMARIMQAAYKLGAEMRALEKLTGYPSDLSTGLEIAIPDIDCNENGGDLYTYNIMSGIKKGLISN